MFNPYSNQNALKILKRWFLLLLLHTIPTYSLAESISLFRGIGADSHYMSIVPNILTGELRLDPTYFWGINYSSAIQNRGENRFTKSLIKNRITPEWEAQITKYKGLQDNYEAHFALLLRSRNFTPAIFNINYAAGIGPSYASSKPTYENGSAVQANIEQRLFQTFLTFEVELSSRSMPEWRFPLRIHHRSGVFGLIGPPHIGSNFVTFGLRYRF